MRLELNRIRVDPGVQQRVALDETKVEEYREAMEAGDVFPPLVVFQDADGVIWLADGNHRLIAAGRAGHTTVEVDVRQGSRRDAILYACGANARHGLPRTTGDKERSIRTLLSDPTWSQWSSAEIARRCGLGSEHLVRKVRARMGLDGAERVCVRKGEVVTINTSNIGRNLNGRAVAGAGCADAHHDNDGDQTQGLELPRPALRLANVAGGKCSRQVLHAVQVRRSGNEYRATASDGRILLCAYWTAQGDHGDQVRELLVPAVAWRKASQLAGRGKVRLSIDGDRAEFSADVDGVTETIRAREPAGIFPNVDQLLGTLNPGLRPVCKVTVNPRLLAQLMDAVASVLGEDCVVNLEVPPADSNIPLRVVGNSVGGVKVVGILMRCDNKEVA